MTAIARAFPAGVAGWRSPYPTVATVTMVRYRESNRENPSSRENPATPATMTRAKVTA